MWLARYLKHLFHLMYIIEFWFGCSSWGSIGLHYNHLGLFNKCDMLTFPFRNNFRRWLCLFSCWLGWFLHISIFLLQECYFHLIFWKGFFHLDHLRVFFLILYGVLFILHCVFSLFKLDWFILLHFLFFFVFLFFFLSILENFNNYLRAWPLHILLWALPSPRPHHKLFILDYFFYLKLKLGGLRWCHLNLGFLSFLFSFQNLLLTLFSKFTFEPFAEFFILFFNYIGLFNWVSDLILFYFMNLILLTNIY